MSHGWVYRCQWICHHDLTGHNLDLSVAGDPGPSQHIVRDAWRAWCLQRDAASSRRDADLDCLVTSAIFAGWIGMPLGSLLLLSWTISTGGCFSPAALGGRVNGVPVTCLWPGCSELGTFDHFAWSCPCRPVDLAILPKPGEFL